jgi:uncharacterized membrane protein
VTRLVLVPLGALALSLALWHALRLAPASAALATFVLLAPWIALLPGLLARRQRAYGLGLLAVLPVLSYALMELVANPGARPYATATALSSLALFLALGVALRLSRGPPR